MSWTYGNASLNLPFRCLNYICWRTSIPLGYKNTKIQKYKNTQIQKYTHIVHPSKSVMQDSLQLGGNSRWNQPPQNFTLFMKTSSWFFVIRFKGLSDISSASSISQQSLFSQWFQFNWIELTKCVSSSYPDKLKCNTTSTMSISSNNWHQRCM